MSLPAPAPIVLPEVRPFWEATARGKLLLPQCEDCQTVIWYPRPVCPACGSLRVSWREASGHGQVYTYTVNRRGQANLAEYQAVDTYVLAYVELEEGPRILTNIVDCEPDAVRIGMPVTVVFHDTGQGSALVRFRPR